MADLLTNIDPIRARIMRLENQPEFRPEDWILVLDALRKQGRVAAGEDAYRRMKCHQERCAAGKVSVW